MREALECLESILRKIPQNEREMIVVREFEKVRFTGTYVIS